VSKRDLTQGDIVRHIVRMAWPMTVGIGAVISFSLADTYFIGQLGAQKLTAIGYTFPVTTFFFNLIFGMAIAMSAVVSHDWSRRERRCKTNSNSRFVYHNFIFICDGDCWICFY